MTSVTLCQVAIADHTRKPGICNARMQHNMWSRRQLDTVNMKNELHAIDERRARYKSIQAYFRAVGSALYCLLCKPCTQSLHIHWIQLAKATVVQLCTPGSLILCCTHMRCCLMALKRCLGCCRSDGATLDVLHETSSTAVIAANTGNVGPGAHTVQCRDYTKVPSYLPISSAGA